MVEATPTKLIVYLAFVRDEEGDLQPAFEAREAQSEQQAKQQDENSPIGMPLRLHQYFSAQ